MDRYGCFIGVGRYYDRRFTIFPVKRSQLVDEFRNQHHRKVHKTFLYSSRKFIGGRQSIVRLELRHEPIERTAYPRKRFAPLFKLDTADEPAIA